MDSEPKKISFGFNKQLKKSNLIIKKPIVEKKVDLIDCIESQSIKIIDHVEEEYKPLVIPIKDNTKTILDRILAAKKLKEKSKNDIIDERPDSELTLDELAARELIRDAQTVKTTPNAVKVHTLPAVEDKLILEGSAEPTLEDYDNVPIGDYGLAMLRGMGWSEKTGIGKKDRVGLLQAPELRPKGMGLGANKIVNKEKTNMPTVDKDGKELSLIKDAFAKIIAGKEKGNYCVVQSLDDESGRVIVKTSLKGEVLSLNEFLLVPVTGEEYARSSKVLNNAKYEEYLDKKNIKTEKVNDKLKISKKYVKKEYSSESDSRSRSNSRSNSKHEDYVDKKYIKTEKTNDKRKKSEKYAKKEYSSGSDSRSRSNSRSNSKYEDYVDKKHLKTDKANEKLKISKKYGKKECSSGSDSRSRSNSRSNSKYEDKKNIKTEKTNDKLKMSKKYARKEYSSDSDSRSRSNSRNKYEDTSRKRSSRPDSKEKSNSRNRQEKYTEKNSRKTHETSKSDSRKSSHQGKSNSSAASSNSKEKIDSKNTNITRGDMTSSSNDSEMYYAHRRHDRTSDKKMFRDRSRSGDRRRSTLTSVPARAVNSDISSDTDTESDSCTTDSSDSSDHETRSSHKRHRNATSKMTSKR